jgi:hypothetical protein
MREFRNGVTLVCFVAFSIVASLAALKTIQAGLPETPSSTGAALLIAHLSEVDLADEGRPLKRHMARRVMHELNDEVDWQSEIAALTEPQKKQLIDNLGEMAIEIIEEKIEIYRDRPDRDKRRFVSRQVDEVMRWAMMLDRASRNPGENGVPMTAMLNLMNRLSKWYSEASPEKRKEMLEFQKAFQEQLTERYKRNMRPGMQ